MIQKWRDLFGYTTLGRCEDCDGSMDLDDSHCVRPDEYRAGDVWDTRFVCSSCFPEYTYNPSDNWWKKKTPIMPAGVTSAAVDNIKAFVKTLTVPAELFAVINPAGARAGSGGASAAAAADAKAPTMDVKVGSGGAGAGLASWWEREAYAKFGGAPVEASARALEGRIKSVGGSDCPTGYWLLKIGERNRLTTYGGIAASMPTSGKENNVYLGNTCRLAVKNPQHEMTHLTVHERWGWGAHENVEIQTAKRDPRFTYGEHEQHGGFDLNREAHEYEIAHFNAGTKECHLLFDKDAAPVNYPFVRNQQDLAASFKPGTGLTLKVWYRACTPVASASASAKQ